VRTFGTGTAAFALPKAQGWAEAAETTFGAVETADVDETALGLIVGTEVDDTARSCWARLPAGLVMVGTFDKHLWVPALGVPGTSRILMDKSSSSSSFLSAAAPAGGSLGFSSSAFCSICLSKSRFAHVMTPPATSSSSSSPSTAEAFTATLAFAFAAAPALAAAPAFDLGGAAICALATAAVLLLAVLAALAPATAAGAREASPSRPTWRIRPANCFAKTEPLAAIAHSGGR